MTAVRDFLRRRRKAELQTIYQFWYPGESRLGTRVELEKRVAQALTGGVQLQERVARLSQVQNSLLTSLLHQPPVFAAPVRALSERLENQGATGVEVESAARMLCERGFMDRVRDPALGPAEMFQVPEELASRLEEVLRIAERQVAPEHQLTQKRLPFEIDFEGEGLRDRIQRLESSGLRQLVELALENRGVLELASDRVEELLGPDHLRQAMDSGWAAELEAAGIGTIGPISLKDFGIQVGEPALIVLQEWMRFHCNDRLEDVQEPDTVIEAGVDLYIDIDRMASRFEAEPVRLTRENRISKRVKDGLRAVLCLPRLEGFVDGDLTAMVLGISERLGVIENYAGAVRADQERLKLWRRLDLTRQVQAVLERFLKENQGARWSFHQEILRGILIEFLEERKPGGWISFDALISTVISTYMLELDERAVRDTLRERREANFSRERLSSPFARLGSDLVFWVLHRFLPLGVCELGTREGRLTTFRLTALGKEIFAVERQPQDSRILVNPDFEIILFCEGLRGLRLELALSRFGERLSAERIRRYRVTRDSMREGIRSGLTLGEIESLLEDACDHPLPGPVRVQLNDWGKDLDWIHVRQCVLISGIKEGRRRELLEFLDDVGYLYQECPDGSLVLTNGDVDGSRIVGEFADRGWLARVTGPEQPALALETDEDASAVRGT